MLLDAEAGQPDPRKTEDAGLASPWRLATSSDRELDLDERYTSPQSTPTQITPANTSKMPATTIKPITGMLRRGLVLDLSVAFGTSPSFQMTSESGTQLGLRKEEPLGIAMRPYMLYR